VGLGERLRGRDLRVIAAPRPRFGLGVAQCALAACAWGTWALFLRPTGLPGTASAPILLVMIGLSLLPAIAFDRVPPRWDRTSLVLLGIFGVTDAINCGAYFMALSVTTIGVAVLSHYLAPLLVALFSPLIDGERVRGAPLAAVVATIGLALVLEPWKGGGDGRLLGASLGALSAFGYAGNLFAVRRLSDRVGAARAVSFHAFVSAALLLPLMPFGAMRAVGARSWTLLVVSGVLLGGWSGLLFTRGLRVIGPTRAAALAFLEPLVAVIVGALAFGEAIGPATAVGTLLVVASGWWVTRARIP
jgi:drug/metabolite transporter (DMT)-like permease